MTRGESADIPAAILRALAGGLRSGPLGIDHSPRALVQVAGDCAATAGLLVERLKASGMSSAQMAVAVDVLADARELFPDPGRFLELVLSGPDVPGVPTADTAATMRALIGEAREELLLVGYAVHNARDLFEPLATRIRQDALRVSFCLEIARTPGDRALDGEIVRRFASEFTDRHWPWPRRPRVFYDPRSLSADLTQRSSLHAKCVVADRSAALITSANFTEAAQERNIEVGVLVRHAPLVGRLCTYFEDLISRGQLRECVLPGRRG